MFPKGNVEVWLGKVEEQMKTSVKHQISESLKDAAVSPRSEWVLRWPGQVILVCSQVAWTAGVTKSLEEGGLQGLSEFSKDLQKQVLGLTDIVRGQLSGLARITLGAL